MATSRGVSKVPWQGLLRRGRALLGLHNSRLKDPPFEGLEEVIGSIDTASVVQCKEPVRIVGAETECLCSYNQIWGPGRTINVPGDTRRPRTELFPMAGPTTHALPDPMIHRPSSQVSIDGTGPRAHSWDTTLASLYAMKPNMKLDDVDVMANEDALTWLLGIALSSHSGAFYRNAEGFALKMSLVNNTLLLLPRNARRLKLSASTSRFMKSYEAATVPVPGAEPNPRHNQLMRYNIGPISLAVLTSLNGSVQELPTTKEPSGPPRTRNIHGIDVITVGQGVLTPTAFHASPNLESPNSDAQKRSKFRTTWAPRLWMSGQTKVGVVDVIRPGQGTDSAKLTVVELGDRVRSFEEGRQEGLRRLPGLLALLRDTVRAHGGPCVAVYHGLKGGRRSILSQGSPRSLGNYVLQIHGAGPEDEPMLLDWHKEQFWSKSISNEHDEPREKSAHEPARPQKSVIRQWAKLFGF